MIFNNDRLQYSTEKNMYFYYEFIKVEDIEKYAQSTKEGINILKEIQQTVDVFLAEKIDFIMNMKEKIAKIFIVYQKGKNKYVMMTNDLKDNKKYKVVIYKSLKEFRKVFQRLNNIDQNASYSKALGNAKEEIEDVYVNKLLGVIHKNKKFHDDNGIELTQLLLNGQGTKGFDLDLFQYIPSTDEYVLFEFLKRKNNYVTNITAHPKRYCWNGKMKDNKQKFNSLWKAKEFFKGRLFLVSYSDDLNEDISLMEVIQCDEEKGILEERKYRLTTREFICWLRDMNTYNEKDKNYLKNFKMVHYGPEFFEDFKNKIKDEEYGKELIN